MAAAKCPLEKCFPDFMPFLGGPHKNINLGLYNIGFVNKILIGSTSSSLTKITGYQMFDWGSVFRWRKYYFFTFKSRPTLLQADTEASCRSSNSYMIIINDSDVDRMAI